MSLRPFRITCIACNPEQVRSIKLSVQQAGGDTAVEIAQIPRIDETEFPKQIVHAVILSVEALRSCDPTEQRFLKTATGWGTLRLYLLAEFPATESSPLDDFVQRTDTGDIPQLAREILAFFQHADAMNRVGVRRAFRDVLCKNIYSTLGLLWPFSYFCVFVLIAYLILKLVGRPVEVGLLHQSAVLTALSAGAGFFLTHVLYAVLKNAALRCFVVRRFPPLGFFIPICALVSLAVGAVWSCRLLECAWQLPFWSLLAAALYALYLYCHRIRAELTSLSQIQSQLESNGQHSDTLLNIGSVRIPSTAFPVFPHKSKEIFISYMHRSEWSVRTASQIHDQLKKTERPIFFDRSTIETGSLWRTQLMRGLSECGLFIAVLDDEVEATNWVLSESIYAATLRKNVGKPRILLAIRGTSVPARLAQGPFERIYRDVFTYPKAHRPGTEILMIPPEGLTQVRLLSAIKNIRPISLLP